MISAAASLLQILTDKLSERENAIPFKFDV
jgi:hypothetical protein